MQYESERQLFRDTVRRRGLRMTATRLALFDEVFTQHGHLDVQQLIEALRRRGSKISRATVYRNLDLLESCGLVKKHQMGGRQSLYEHVHGGESHDHLVCRECGRVVEFVSVGIAALQQEICRAHGFDPSDHSLQIESRCLDCRSADS
ncbi:MAG: Fur family transcriptional regulator [Acidobacteriota bacterium]